MANLKFRLSWYNQITVLPPPTQHHEAIAECVCHWCSYHILTSSVVYYWTDARQHGIHLFYIIKKLNATAFLFHNPSQLLESRPLPTFLLFIQNEAILLVAMCSKELWLVQNNHATVKLDSNALSWNENLQRKQNWTAKSINVKETAAKIKSQFLSSE